MKECKANHSIQCAVSSCNYHCGNEDYCSLNSIRVGSHETDPKVTQCTDCKSFEKRK